MANPKVRPNLSFYPEDSGKRVSEARQAERWLHEAPADQLTPMARLGVKDFYIHEPAMTTDGIICMPVRWFTRDQKIYAKCWEMQPIHTDSTSAWRVIVRNNYIISQDNLLKNWHELQADHDLYGLPSFDSITGLFKIVDYYATN